MRPPARLFLFDDARARRWAPFSLTRPVGELLFGTMTLRARAERVVALACEGHITRSALRGLDEPGVPPVVAVDALPEPHTPDTWTFFLSSRVALDAPPDLTFEDAARLVLGGRTVGWVVPPGAAPPSELWIREPDAAPPDGSVVEVRGALLEAPWSLMAANPERLRRDLSGKESLTLGDGAHVEELVAVDTHEGPIFVDAGARVRGPARLVGPLYIGPGTEILGGEVGASSIGPRCKVRGEVAHAVMVGFSNKAHDGYLGHALVGQWVNLGAGTTNSDLKNTYGTVRVWTPDGDVDTGLRKVGCFLGDHVKTGIGTLLNTGTVVGAGSNLFGGAMPPVAVPPFSWGRGEDLVTHRLEKFLETAAITMGRRGRTLTPGMREVLTRAWERTAGRREHG